MSNEQPKKDMNLEAIATRMARRVDFLRKGEVRLAVNIISIAMADQLIKGYGLKFKGYFSIEHKLEKPKIRKNPRTGEDMQMGYRYYIRANFREELFTLCNYQFWSEEEVAKRPICYTKVPPLKQRAYYEYSNHTRKEILRVTDEHGEYIPRRARLKKVQEERKERHAMLEDRKRRSREFKS